MDEDCWTCKFLDQYDEALSGADQILFQNLHSPVVASLGIAMTLALLFSTQIRVQLKTFAPEVSRSDWFLEFYSNSGRLIAATVALSSYSFWHTWVVGTINVLIGTVARAVIGATTMGDTTWEFGGVFFSGDHAAEDQFRVMMAAVYDKTYAPIGTLLEAFAATKFGLTNMAGQFMFSMNIYTMSFAAALSNLSFFIILVMHKTMTVFVIGLGPLILALWVFKKTQPYAYSLVRFLLATGSVVIGASFLVGMGLSVINSSLKGAPIFYDDNVPKIALNQLNDWVFSSQFVGMIGAYFALVIFMIIAVVVGVATVLAQRPQLEK